MSRSQRAQTNARGDTLNPAQRRRSGFMVSLWSSRHLRLHSHG